VLLGGFRDSFFPYQGTEIKEYFERVVRTPGADVIFTHSRNDLHQDHRLVGELTWNTFRNHLILEYEIPKYDGDLGQPNVFVALEEETARTKAQSILRSYSSQRERLWFKDETFLSLMRLRGIEAGAKSGFAEGFTARKLLLGSAETAAGNV
jgi:LmbE family N-acetylglucosaminyl deacetylase